MSDKITDYLPETEILAQLAEEAAELAQAALKLRRAIDGTNPTPKSVDECKANLLEEIADVSLCACLLMTPDTDYWTVYDTMAGKRNRWLERLKEKEGAGMAEFDAQRCLSELRHYLHEDVANVVRCRDCVYYGNHPNGLCYAWTEPKDNAKGYTGDVHCVEPDDFCSCGERRRDIDE